MKLTPEQKAFREYGKALGRLEKFRDDHKGWKCVNFLSRRHYWRSGNYVCCETQDVTEQHALLIRDAWQKRAACREWGHPMRRRCSNCEHDPKQYKCCVGCAAMGWPVYWKPRKEEQDND